MARDYLPLPQFTAVHPRHQRPRLQKAPRCLWPIAQKLANTSLCRNQWLTLFISAN